MSRGLTDEFRGGGRQLLRAVVSGQVAGVSRV